MRFSRTLRCTFYIFSFLKKNFNKSGIQFKHHIKYEINVNTAQITFTWRGKIYLKQQLNGVP